MKLLVIGPRQSGLAQSEEGKARARLQAAQVESYVVLTPHKDEGNIAAFVRMFKEAVRTEYDTVSAQDPWYAGLLALWVARRASARLNVQVHADLASHSMVKRALARFVLRRADSIRVVSERIRAQVVRMGSTSPITVLPLYIDVERYAQVVRRPHERKTILWIGRFEEEKDPESAIRVLEDVRRSGLDATLVLVGDGSLRRSLEARAEGLPVEFPGWVSDIRNYLELADVVVCTSRHESWGASIIEALAAGVPVVAPDVGVAREAGAIVVPREKLGEAAAEALRLGGASRVQLRLLNKEDWIRAWKASL